MLLHDGDAIPYATIVEVHHPAYLDEPAAFHAGLLEFLAALP